jgi:hypothetical protein
MTGLSLSFWTSATSGAGRMSATNLYPLLETVWIRAREARSPRARRRLETCLASVSLST